MPISQDDFRNALSRFGSGVTVVTTRDASGRFHGITVSAFCAVSLDPPLVLICIEQVTGSHKALMDSGYFAVNVLEAAQQHLSERFASQVEDKFEGVGFSVTENALPILDNCLVSLECKTKEFYGGGDHTVFIGEVEHSTVGDGDPLVYYKGDYRTIAKK
jgi:flavin reductase (DIM6/NTAB) family NADH-FMN oxidoreductase RutF